jgi:tRNA A-37 threonylcarbamoyl transferase component Bud32
MITVFNTEIRVYILGVVGQNLGAVAGVAALAVAAKRRFGRRDPNFKGFTSPGEDWDRIEAEARQGGKKWNVFEDNKKAAAAACASAKIDHYIREDVFVPIPRCVAGRGATNYYVVHPSEKYGIKYAHNSGRAPTDSFIQSKDNLLEEGQILLHANRSGVPTPRLLKATEDVLVMEHLRDFVPLHKTRSGFNGYALDKDSPITLKRNLLSACETMHTAGIVHNDIHFKNILIHPKTKEIRIIDFEIASFAHQEPGMFTAEIQRVPYLIGLRDVRSFERRWDKQTKRIEKYLSYDEERKSEAIVRGYYQSLRFHMEHEHNRYASRSAA